MKLLALWLLGGAATLARAQGDLEAQTLRGLKGVGVVVEKLRPEVERSGLTVSLIQTDVELKLRLAGIPVLTDAEVLDTPGYPYLYIQATIVVLSNGWAYSVLAALKQLAILERDPAIKSYDAITWRENTVATIGPSRAVAEVRSDIKDLTDKFINAYLSVNPKK
jgi:hypothetical protein